METQNRSTFGSLPSIFDDIFGYNSASPQDRRLTMPSVNIRENDEEYAIEVAAPGLKKKDFDIKMDGSILTVSLDKDNSKGIFNEDYKQREFNYQSFRRSFNLPMNISTEKVNSSYKNGLLMVSMPKK